MSGHIRPILEKIIFGRTPRYGEMFRRPWTAYQDGQLMDWVGEATGNMTTLPQENSVAQLASRMIRPATEAEGIAPIENGWSTDRGVFMASFVMAQQSNSRTIMYTSGYTNHFGFSRGNNLNGGRIGVDPNMRLYFNKVFTFQEQTLNVNGVITKHYTLLNNNQVLFGRVGKISGVNNDLTLRPSDIYSKIHNDYLTKNAENFGMGNSGVDLDTRVSFGESIKFSNTHNLSQTGYLARIIGAGVYNNSSVDSSGGGVETHLLRSSGHVSEELISNNALFYQMKLNTALSSDGCITFQELAGLFENLPYLVKQSPPHGLDRAPIDLASQSAAMNGAGPELMMALTLHGIVSELMMDGLLTNINFVASNQTPTGNMSFEAPSMMSFVSHRDARADSAAFARRLDTMFFQPLKTSYGIRPVTVHMTSGFNSSTMINISVDNGPMTPYSFPTFADNTYSPVMSNNVNALANVANTVRDVCGHFNIQLQ